MGKIKELFERAETCLSELETLQGKMAEAATDEERTALTTKVDGKSAEYDRLLEQAEAAKSLATRRQKIASLREALPDADGKTLAPEDDDEPKPAGGKVKNKETQEQAHQRLFFDYMGGKEIGLFSDNERDLIHPKSDKFEQGKDGVRLPRSWLPSMFGKRFGKSMDLFSAFDGGKAVQSDVTSDAYLIDTDYLAQLLQLEPEPGHLLGRVTVIPVSGGEVAIPRLQQTDSNEYGGMSFTWIDEGGEKQETEPTFEQVTITCHEVAGYTEISKTMARRNSVQVIPILTRLYREGMRHTLDNVIISGSGTGQPQGMTNATSIRTQARTAAGDVQAADIIRLKHQVLVHNRANSTFIIHDDVEEVLEIDDLTTENPIISNGRLSQYPYEVTNRQPSIGNDGDVLFGDPSAYYLAMEQDIVVEQSRHFKFQNNLLAFAVYAVVGGQLALPRGMAMLQSSTS